MTAIRLHVANVEATTVLSKTYAIHTLGYQMNVYDSERMAGSFEQEGLLPVSLIPVVAECVTEMGDLGADALVINTCPVRENAATKFFGNLGQLAVVKRERPGMQVAVGGCLTQQMREGIIEKAPWADAVFGTHDIDVLPVLLKRVAHNHEAAVEIEESLKVFPSTLLTHWEPVHVAWVSISVGCNNTCTFCIVPYLRGKECGRHPGEILDKINVVVSQGTTEVTLLGQNVNSHGVGFDERRTSAALLHQCGQIERLERMRFTSPYSAAPTNDVIVAMAETPNVMPSPHMPLQSGSDAVLRQMRRSYRRERFMGVSERVRASALEAAITTDIIVGFPNETEEGFQQTPEVVEQVRPFSAFAFLYSPHPSTPAADRRDQIPAEVALDRYKCLVALQEGICTEDNVKLVGSSAEVLICENEGHKDGVTHRVTSRARDNRLVHVTLPGDASKQDLPRPGDMVTARVTYGAPHHLIADPALEGGLWQLWRIRAGDAWE